jgi:hypothetical protein
MKGLTHYRSLAKSDHLGVADLEDLIEKGTPLIFTIKEVKKELGVKVAGKKGDHMIAYFVEDIKPLCLNMTNAKRIRTFIKDNSPFIEHWRNVTLEFYIDKNVTMMGEKTGGVRIKTRQPKPKTTTKPSISPKSFTSAKEAVRKGEFTIEQVKAKYTLSEEQTNQLNAIKNG